MLRFFKRKKYSANVRVEIKHCASVIPNDKDCALVVPSEKGPEFKTVTFGNVKKPFWFQFWKKKEYQELMKIELEKMKEFMGPPSDVIELLKKATKGEGL